MRFDELNLNAPLRNAIEDLGFTNPTEIQEKAFPLIMSGRDIVGVSQTGSGKTFAYLLPILRQLHYSEKKHPRVLIVVPTRELVLQVVSEVEKLTKYMNVRVNGIYGGTNINTQKHEVYKGTDILVATPGRLVDIVLTGVLRLKSIQKLVIDEVDEMLNLGFRPQLMSFMDSLPAQRQNLMFSATLTNDVAELINEYFYIPDVIEISNKKNPLEIIEQVFYRVPNFNTKLNLVEFLLTDLVNFSKVLLFTSSKQFADRVYEKLALKFEDQISVIHSNKSQNFRINSIEDFRSGKSRILISTDIASRGIDIANISHVINFDVPDEPEDYIHRIGRTGRNDNSGIAISFVNEPELKLLSNIEAFINRPIMEIQIPDKVTISGIFTEEEQPVMFDKDYIGNAKKIVETQGAFHEKKEKNKKVNLGGPGVRNPRKSKPVNRGVLKKRASKRK